jgi:hypothetical protein
MLEVALAGAILGVVAIPLLTYSKQGAAATRDTRMSALANVLGSNLLARFGHRSAELSGLLEGKAPDRVDVVNDLLASPMVSREVGAERFADEIRISRLRAVFRLVPQVVHRADLLVCEVRWESHRGRRQIAHTASFARVLLVATF